MIDRWITPEDREIIENSLSHDEYHSGMNPDFFYEEGTFTKVYQDEIGPIMYLRGSKSLRVDIQFVDNLDFERNRAALADNFNTFVQSCKQAGFKELVFNTSAPLLKRFCKNVLKFTDVEGDELRYFIS